MENNQLLKSVGFSDEFLAHLAKYEEMASVIEIKDDFKTDNFRFSNFDQGSDFVIEKLNDYNVTYVVK